HHDAGPDAVPRDPPRARRAVRRDRRPRGRSEGHVRRDLRGRPEGDAANRAARAAADPRDPPPEVQARGGPLEVLPPRPVHDEPPDLLRAPLRLGPARRPERHARYVVQADRQGEGTQGYRAEAAPPAVSVASNSPRGPA